MVYVMKTRIRASAVSFARNRGSSESASSLAMYGGKIPLWSDVQSEDTECSDDCVANPYNVRPLLGGPQLEIYRFP